MTSFLFLPFVSQVFRLIYIFCISYEIIRLLKFFPRRRCRLKSLAIASRLFCRLDRPSLSIVIARPRPRPWSLAVVVCPYLSPFVPRRRYSSFIVATLGESST